MWIVVKIWFWNGSVLSKILLLITFKILFCWSISCKMFNKNQSIKNIVKKINGMSLEIGEIRVDFNKLEKPSSMVSWQQYQVRNCQNFWEPPNLDWKSHLKDEKKKLWRSYQSPQKWSITPYNTVDRIWEVGCVVGFMWEVLGFKDLILVIVQNVVLILCLYNCRKFHKVVNTLHDQCLRTFITPPST